MRDFKTLKVWQKSHVVVCGVYDLVKTFPPEERYALGDQLRRAVVSIPSNIAEGFGRETNKERLRFLSISLGSAAEVEYYFILAHDLNYLPEPEFKRLTGILYEVQRMLRSLYHKIQADEANRRRQRR